jgi:hypothetical protein
MPSWTEKPHVTPTINVNLARCNCDRVLLTTGMRPLAHDTQCAAAPILISCPIPRSVAFYVALGECTERCIPVHTKDGSTGVVHSAWCPARPVRVGCNIGSPDGTWARSEVTDLDVPGRIAGTNAVGDVWRIARERWALVKALVLGEDWDENRATVKLFQQRDAAYVALCDMARAEEAHRNATATLLSALKSVDPASSANTNAASYALCDDGTQNTENGLAAYVEILIEQVGVLP